MIRITVFAVLFCMVSAYPIGLQHGTFRSQSTQGPTWTGTATIIKENMNVTVHRNYLDVELEWTFEADGVAPAQYTDALEIVGNLNLEKGAVVAGLLVWYKDKLLKGKLKKKKLARDAYEKVVDRNSTVPPRPRDPVILESLGSDNYDISIFPVAYQGTRRLRIRYLVPTDLQNGEYRAGFPHAFTAAGTVTVKKSGEVSGFSIVRGYNEAARAEYSDSIELTNVQAYSYGSETPAAIRVKMVSDTCRPNKTTMYAINTNSLVFPGEFVCIDNFSVSRILDSVKARFSASGAKGESGTLGIFAGVGNGSVSCSSGVVFTVNNISTMNSAITWGKPLNFYSRNPVKREIVWQVFLNGELFFKDIESPSYRESQSPEVESKLVAASRKVLSLERTLPKSMAAAFGFADTAYALLALESDNLPDQLAHFYEVTGVPLCDEEDVYADTADVVLIPASGLFDENFLIGSPNKVLDNRTAFNIFEFFQCFFMNNRLIIRFDPAFLDQKSHFEISVYSPTGKRLMQWNKSGIGVRRSLEWSPRDHGVSSGAIIVKVKAGSVTQAKTVALP
jgi:hypothetical protein